jgi:chromosomal replication initiation ATPase DnaA
MLQASEEAFEKKSLLVTQGWNIYKLVEHVAGLLDMEVSDVWSAGKYRHIVKARSLFCYWAVRGLGKSMTDLSKRLNLSPATVTQSVERGEKIVEENHYHFP